MDPYSPPAMEVKMSEMNEVSHRAERSQNVAELLTISR